MQQTGFSSDGAFLVHRMLRFFLPDSSRVFLHEPADGAASIHGSLVQTQKAGGGSRSEFRWDIDVHFEQTNGQARYFGVDDATALADHLAAAWRESGRVIVRNLLPNVEPRVSSFTEGFVRLVRSAYGQQIAEQKRPLTA